MNEHPSGDDLRSFVQRSAPPLTLVEIDRHLSVCAECQARLEAFADTGSLYAGMRQALASESAVDHLTFDEVRAAVEAGPAPAAARHLESCASCRAEVEDLRAFVAPQAKPHKASPAASRHAWRWAAAAAVILAVSALAWRISRRSGEEQFAVAFHDAGGLVAIDAAGKLHTPQSIPTDYAAALRNALTARQLTFPDFVRQHNRPEVLLGAPGRSTGFNVLHPVGESTLSTHPRFEWDALAGAAAYQVSVYDHDFRLVIESPPIAATLWTPEKELPAGRTYTWIVTAHAGRQLVRAPAPPQAEAGFSVLPTDVADRLEQARRQYPDSHLMLAALFAQAGAMAEARHELDLLARSNPGSPAVHDLEMSVRP